MTPLDKDTDKEMGGVLDALCYMAKKARQLLGGNNG